VSRSQSQSVSIFEFAQAEIVAIVRPLLRAYLDEFNDHTDEQCEEFGIVGLMGPVREWHKLQAKWEDALECCGIRWFHATDLQSFEGEFQGWSAVQRERLLGMLVRVVQESAPGMRFLASANSMKAYRRLPQYRKNATKTPYYLSAVSVMSDGARFAHEHFGDRPIEFIFDQKTKHYHLLDGAYKEVLQTEHGHLCAGFSQASHKLVSPVQVADLMAYEASKYLAIIRGRLSLDNLRWPMKQLQTLFFGSETTWFNEHGLMLVTDFWGNYEKADKLLRPNRPLRKKRI
jgi:hypothetical protein